MSKSTGALSRKTTVNEKKDERHAKSLDEAQLVSAEDETASASNEIEMDNLQVVVDPKPPKVEEKEDHGVVKNWTKRMSNKLRKYSFSAAGFSWQTGTDAAYYNGLNSEINLWIGILTALNGLGVLAAIVFVQDQSELWAIVLFYMFSVMSLLLSLSIGILQAIQSAKNLVGKIVSFSVSSAKFGELSRNISDQMDIPPTERDDAIVLQRYTRERFNELEREKPFIRDSTATEWEAYAKALAVTPEKYDSVLKLPDELETVAYLGSNAEEMVKHRGFNPGKKEGELVIDIAHPSAKMVGTGAKVEGFVYTMV